MILNTASLDFYIYSYIINHLGMGTSSVTGVKQDENLTDTKQAKNFYQIAEKSIGIWY